MLNFIKKKDFCIVESSAQFFVGSYFHKEYE